MESGYQDDKSDLQFDPKDLHQTNMQAEIGIKNSQSDGCWLWRWNQANRGKTLCKNNLSLVFNR